MVRISIIIAIVRFRAKEIDQGIRIKRKITTKTLEMVDNLSRLHLLILKTNGITEDGKRCKMKVQKERKDSSNSNRTRERVEMVEVATPDSNSVTYKMHLIQIICHHNSSRKTSSIRILILEVLVDKKDLL